MVKTRKTNNRGVIHYLAETDFAEAAMELLSDGEPLPTNHAAKMIKLHRTNATIMLPAIDNRFDHEWDPSDPHNILEAIDAYGATEATEIYAEQWSAILESWAI